MAGGTMGRRGGGLPRTQYKNMRRREMKKVEEMVRLGGEGMIYLSFPSGKVEAFALADSWLVPGVVQKIREWLTDVLVEAVKERDDALEALGKAESDTEYFIKQRDKLVEMLKTAWDDCTLEDVLMIARSMIDIDEGRVVTMEKVIGEVLNDE
jgi:hypothetical protein